MSLLSRGVHPELPSPRLRCSGHALQLPRGPPISWEVDRRPVHTTLDTARSAPSLPPTPMSIVTLQVGQAGCQGGAALFQQLAAEALPSGGSSSGDWSEAAERFFFLSSSGGGPPKQVQERFCTVARPA